MGPYDSLRKALRKRGWVEKFENLGLKSNKHPSSNSSLSSSASSRKKIKESSEEREESSDDDVDDEGKHITLV